MSSILPHKREVGEVGERRFETGSYCQSTLLFPPLLLCRSLSLTFQHLLQWEHGALEEPHDHGVALVLAHVDLDGGVAQRGLSAHTYRTGQSRSFPHKFFPLSSISKLVSLPVVHLHERPHLLRLHDPVEVPLEVLLHLHLAALPLEVAATLSLLSLLRKLAGWSTNIHEKKKERRKIKGEKRKLDETKRETKKRK